jgi:hypothetical protein
MRLTEPIRVALRSNQTGKNSKSKHIDETTRQYTVNATTDRGALTMEANWTMVNKSEMI